MQKLQKNRKMNISPDQQKALKKIIAWYKDPEKEQFITLGGYAGTGKTTLISVFRHILHKINPSLKVGFISYTGKATRILQNKLIENQGIFPKDSVTTIHSLIYSPVSNSNQEIVGWDIKDEIDRDFLIIDEASMVSRNIWEDLLAYKKPILAVGDHGQLPPIAGKFNLMENPEICLTKIHRQSKGNPIIEVSTQARKKGSVENNTRVRINNQIRSFLGYQSEYPEEGDRVICLRNNHQRGIFNGMLGQIKSIESHSEKWFFAHIAMEDGFDFEGLILREQFNCAHPLNFSKRRRETLEGDLFDFGYAMTVHKAQGSQAKRVILFEERFARMDEENWRRWLYTGVTRAEEELYIIG